MMLGLLRMPASCLAGPEALQVLKEAALQVRVPGADDQRAHLPGRQDCGG